MLVEAFDLYVVIPAFFLEVFKGRGFNKFLAYYFRHESDGAGFAQHKTPRWLRPCGPTPFGVTPFQKSPNVAFGIWKGDSA